MCLPEFRAQLDCLSTAWYWYRTVLDYSMPCEHGRQKSKCKECGLCEHGNQKCVCEECRSQAGDLKDGPGSASGTAELLLQKPAQLNLLVDAAAAAGQLDEAAGGQPPAKRRRLAAEAASAGALGAADLLLGISGAM